MRHERGIIHRDLKPANILIERTADSGLRLKVADFGIGGIAAGRALAQASGRQHTSHQDMTQALRGAYSPLYASPQQVRADPNYRPSQRDDVYALGVIWYQMLTGDLTTGAPSGRSWEEDLVSAGVPREHVALMTACFETNPNARPADAGDLAKRLEQLLVRTVRPIAVPPAGPSDATEGQGQSLQPTQWRDPGELKARLALFLGRDCFGSLLFGFLAYIGFSQFDFSWVCFGFSILLAIAALFGIILGIKEMFTGRG